MKAVLINGGSRGIGRELVHAFANRGYRVAFTYHRSEKEALSLSKETGAIAILADSASEKDIKNAVKIAAEEIGAPDILVNNAAVSGFSLMTDLSLSAWEEAMAVNLTAPFLYAREVAPEMIRRKYGRIINIASIWGETGASCETHYSAAKAGLIGFTKALAKELAPSGITVNAVSPGFIDTDMNRALSIEDRLAFLEDVPVARAGTPKDVARAVLFLAEEEASYITGEILRVNGGFLI